jgi:hypothetical protein
MRKKTPFVFIALVLIPLAGIVTIILLTSQDKEVDTLKEIKNNIIEEQYTNREEPNVGNSELGYSYHLPDGYKNWFEASTPIPTMPEILSVEYIVSQIKPLEGYQSKTVSLTLFKLKEPRSLMDWTKLKSESEFTGNSAFWYTSTDFNYIKEDTILYINDEHPVKSNGINSPVLLLRIDNYKFLEVSQALSNGDNSFLIEIIASLKLGNNYALSDEQLNEFKLLVKKYEKT